MFNKLRSVLDLTSSLDWIPMLTNGPHRWSPLNRKKSSSHKSLAAVFAQEVPTAPVPRLEPLEGGEDFRSSVILPE
jgi:hypothetical protein